jgi:2-polyprenyl-6-methoxyphenol hydroxylase-like FAD-dependent oxidoreductase
MPLKAIVVGAGIAGLCAALSLREAGWTVEVSHVNSNASVQSEEVVEKERVGG